MSSTSPFLIVIQGAPGVGKTTLVGRLRQEYDIGCISKDDIKELLFDKVGIPADRDISRMYGIASVHAMFALSRTLLRNGISHILESAFDTKYANDDIASLATEGDIRIVQLYCYADPATQSDRCNQRLEQGHRHAGHHDVIHISAEDFKQFNQQYSRLNIDHTIELDMTRFGDEQFRSLCAQLDTIIKEEQ